MPVNPGRWSNGEMVDQTKIYKGFRFIVSDPIGPNLTKIEIRPDHQIYFQRGAMKGRKSWSQLSGRIKDITISIPDDSNESPSAEWWTKNSRNIHLREVYVVQYFPFIELDAMSSNIVMEGLLCGFKSSDLSENFLEEIATEA